MCREAQFSSEVGNARDRPWPLHDAHTRFDASPFSGRRYLGSCTARPPRPRHRRGAMQIAPTIAASLQAGSIRNRGRGPQCSGRGSGELWPLLGDGAQSPRRLIGPHHPGSAIARPIDHQDRVRRSITASRAPWALWSGSLPHRTTKSHPSRAGSQRGERSSWNTRNSTGPLGWWRMVVHPPTKAASVVPARRGPRTRMPRRRTTRGPATGISRRSSSSALSGAHGSTCPSARPRRRRRGPRRARPSTSSMIRGAMRRAPEPPRVSAARRAAARPPGRAGDEWDAPRAATVASAVVAGGLMWVDRSPGDRSTGPEMRPQDREPRQGTPSGGGHTRWARSCE